MIYLLFAAILLLALGLALLGAGRRRRVTTGLPAGEVVYDDTGLGEAVREPLVSRRYGLVGRPDYLVRVKQGGREVTIPVEVKSRRKPAQPLESHVLQLGAYCILVEEQSKAAPPYGLIRYADGTFRIPYTGELRRAVLDTAEAIRRAATSAGRASPTRGAGTLPALRLSPCLRPRSPGRTIGQLEYT